MNWLSGESTPTSVWVALGISIAALIFSISVYSQISIMNAPQVPQDLSQRLNDIESRLHSLPTVNQTPMERRILVEWTTDQAGQDRFFPYFVVVNQGDVVDITFLNNDSEDGHTFTLISPEGYNFQINLTAPGMLNSANGLTFTTPSVGNSPGVTLGGSIGGLYGEGKFVASWAGIYQYVCVYHETMVGYLVVLPNAAYAPQP